MHPLPQFPLFRSHLDLADQYWKDLVLPGDLVIDATCGNGHDTLKLAQIVLKSEQLGKMIVFDTQLKALETTKQRLKLHFSEELLNQVQFLHCCHSLFPKEIALKSVRLIVYNLGYLPGGDKTLTTMHSTTLNSLHAAKTLIMEGGAICVTCYPGHPEGKVEEEKILDFVEKLDPKEWNCCHHRWLNRKASPSLLLMQRSTY